MRKLAFLRQLGREGAGRALERFLGLIKSHLDF